MQKRAAAAGVTSIAVTNTTPTACMATTMAMVSAAWNARSITRTGRPRMRAKAGSNDTSVRLRNTQGTNASVTTVTPVRNARSRMSSAAICP